MTGHMLLMHLQSVVLSSGRTHLGCRHSLRHRTLVLCLNLNRMVRLQMIANQLAYRGDLLALLQSWAP